MTAFTILLNGPIKVTRRLKEQASGSRAIAADAGIAHAGPLGLKVELWVGDFDSTTKVLAALHEQVPRQTFPVAKDKTDGELAAEEALKRGATSLLLVGSFGGQADHALGHSALALKLACAGVRTVLTSGEEEAHPVLPGKTELDLPSDSRLSLIALADLSGLTLRGTHWTLDKAEIELGSTRTISNITTGKVEIVLASGYGMLIVYPKADLAHEE
jgi:thiamine pyrophosphokinase